VREVYSTSNGKGYIFMLTANGYGGDLTIICGIDPDGNIISVKTLSAQNETKGMGSRVTEPSFEGQFTGKRNGDAFDTLSGATISSKAYVGAVNDALAAFEIVKGEN
jgi:electron transport complex protein RnfG